MVALRCQFSVASVFFVVANVQAWVPHTGSLNDVFSIARHNSALAAGGFGAADGAAKKKELKLKPKQQWDRFAALKKEDVIPVGIKIADEWLAIGAVKSKGSDMTEIAVARQRALIAEHAKRLYPTKVLKAQVEWGYQSDDDWVVVDKSVLQEEGVPTGVEKKIGFEGKPDPSTGYYCVYNEGKLVNGDADMRPSSKKLQ